MRDKPNYSTHDLIVDRIRHALVFAEASQRCLRELLALIEQAEAENNAFGASTTKGGTR